jgi:hypothetical protein
MLSRAVFPLSLLDKQKIMSPPVVPFDMFWAISSLDIHIYDR